MAVTGRGRSLQVDVTATVDPPPAKSAERRELAVKM
jgi:hypothetical protein